MPFSMIMSCSGEDTLAPALGLALGRRTKHFDHVCRRPALVLGLRPRTGRPATHMVKMFCPPALGPALGQTLTVTTAMMTTTALRQAKGYNKDNGTDKG